MDHPQIAQIQKEQNLRKSVKSADLFPLVAADGRAGASRSTEAAWRDAAPNKANLLARLWCAHKGIVENALRRHYERRQWRQTKPIRERL